MDNIRIEELCIAAQKIVDLSENAQGMLDDHLTKPEIYTKTMIHRFQEIKMLAKYIDLQLTNEYLAWKALGR